MIHQIAWIVNKPEVEGSGSTAGWEDNPTSVSFFLSFSTEDWILDSRIQENKAGAAKK
jgi:hypothetical protein